MLKILIKYKEVLYLMLLNRIKGLGKLRILSVEILKYVQRGFTKLLFLKSGSLIPLTWTVGWIWQ
jgi:hypothetical protein